MRALFPLVCIALALATAMILHESKIHNNSENPQHIATGLKGIRPYLSTIQFVPIRNLSNDPVNTIYARLLLAPVHSDAFRLDHAADTILEIAPSSLNYWDSLHSRIIWENKFQDLNFKLLTHN